MELKDTVRMMLSDDYKERFKAEYWQTRIRYEKLQAVCANYAEVKPKSSLLILKTQKRFMHDYLNALEVRAEREDIDLQDPLREAAWIITDGDGRSEGRCDAWIEFHCPICNEPYGLEEGQYNWYPGDPIPFHFCHNCGTQIYDQKDCTAVAQKPDQQEAPDPKDLLY